MGIESRLDAAFEKVKQELLNRRTPDGHWTGRLSSSALSTATAVSALVLYQKNTPDKKNSNSRDANGSLRRFHLQKSVDYLLSAQNPDGGWGDTDKSFSNISTTLLVKSALILYYSLPAEGTRGSQAEYRPYPAKGEECIQKADEYIERNGGMAAVKKRYGKDQTFSVPILTNAALAGLVDWKDVPQLPFERAAMPQWMFRLLNLQVVSYAIPALVAIGQCTMHHTQCTIFNPFNAARRWAVKPTLKLIEKMQPASGGYLEAAPLTAFVAMSLIGCGLTEHPIVQNCLRFLIDTVREDGSWAIDTNLATWATTLSVNALGRESFTAEESKQIAEWILSCQHTQKHPFTGAKPGGWGWTDLSGAVPDADDTPGAVLALCELLPNIKQNEDLFVKAVQEACLNGVLWLLSLQNSDGGIPTFCRGWGVLPFDKSSTDLTAHTLRSFERWEHHRETQAGYILDRCLNGRERQYFSAKKTMLRFLKKTQNADGSWFPLWFGNQHQPDDVNPFYGTAKVILALNSNTSFNVNNAINYLASHQNPDGSWGNGIEETAVVVESLATVGKTKTLQTQTVVCVLQRGLNYLLNAVEDDTYKKSSPIGLYFAKLWYYEDLYPLIFTAAALRQCLLNPFVCRFDEA